MPDGIPGLFRAVDKEAYEEHQRPYIPKYPGMALAAVNVIWGVSQGSMMGIFCSPLYWYYQKRWKGNAVAFGEFCIARCAVFGGTVVPAVALAQLVAACYYARERDIVLGAVAATTSETVQATSRWGSVGVFVGGGAGMYALPHPTPALRFGVGAFIGWGVSAILLRLTRYSQYALQLRENKSLAQEG
eukprot:TRINITY_DN85515_c0_g1_i1.p1 TRINITY_DN85515_c0_g1~~TRINITY_DN85515_c0_g1_i1.p1  ORF type:complete len:188 (+),score=11.86 TRINITY_DN85515_c0_g1_i1:34-597(+)